MEPWTDERVWGAVDEWRWRPPSSKQVVTSEYELVVTPGSSTLNYVYGFHVDDAARVAPALSDLRKQVESLGGTGFRIQVTPLSRPFDLAEQLVRQGFTPRDPTEVLVWELKDVDGWPRLPDFRSTPGITVREVRTGSEYERYLDLATAIFDDPAPTGRIRKGFLKDFRQTLRDRGHSDLFLAWEGDSPAGRAGMEVAGAVARFYGAGVLPQYRERGVYGALVQVRCVAAEGRKAEIVLVTARVGTSGPILKRHGFRTVGPFRAFDLRW